MNKKEWVLICLVLFLFTYLGAGGVKTYAAHSSKTEQIDAALKVILPTVDDEWIVGNYYTAGHDKIVIVLNDISENIHTKGKKNLCSYLLQEFDVLNIDYRGYGESSGDFTGGNKEVLDIQAAVNFLAGKDYQKIGIMGYGFGGYMAIQGAAFIESVDCVVVVNAPAQLYRKEQKNYDAGKMRVLTQMGEAFLKRLLGMRLSDQIPDQGRPIQPYLESMRQPLLIIHAKGSGKATEEESRLIYQHAPAPRSIYIVNEDQVLISDKQIIYARAVEWFQHIFITQ